MSTFCTSPVITDDDGYDLLDRLAILIMTADHYCINSGHLLGEFAMRRRHLLRLGYTVVEVRRFLGKGFSSQFTTSRLMFTSLLEMRLKIKEKKRCGQCDKLNVLTLCDKLSVC